MKHLRVYQLAVTFHRSVQTLPIKGELRDQLHRASMSIVLNIAEHYGKPSQKDRLKYLNIAMGSVRESQACFDILPFTAEKSIAENLDYLAASLWKLIRVQV